MWRVTRGQFNDLYDLNNARQLRQRTTFPDQPILRWAGIQPNTNGVWFLGDDMPVGTDGEPEEWAPPGSDYYSLGELNFSNGRLWPNQTPRHYGTERACAASVCFAFNVEGVFEEGQTTKIAKLALGSRFSAEVCIERVPGGLVENGKQEWRGHFHNYGVSGANSTEIVSIKIKDGDSTLDERLVHIANPRGLFSLVAGFCYHEFEPRFFAWLSTVPAFYGTNFPQRVVDFNNNALAAFGAGTAFVSAAIGDEATHGEEIGGLVELDLPGPLNKIYTAAEKPEPFWLTNAAKPNFTMPFLFPRDGQNLADSEWSDEPYLFQSIGSLRSHHANFLCPRNQEPKLVSVYGRVDASYLSVFDCGGHRELFPHDSTLVGLQSRQPGRMFFLNAHAGYKNTDVASFLLSGTTSTLHHDDAVNEKLSSLAIKVQVQTSGAGSVSFSTTVSAPAVGINEYYGVGQVEVNEETYTVRVLASLVRNDFISENSAGARPSTAIDCIVSLSIGKEDITYAQTFTRALNDDQWEQFLSGQADGAAIPSVPTSNPFGLDGAVTVKAAG